ncbi:hypothetical protein, partial [Tsukamurella paurometabola]
RVIDNSDPKKPRQTAVLNELAMVTGTWESLKANEKRGLLVGASLHAAAHRPDRLPAAMTGFTQRRSVRVAAAVVAVALAVVIGVVIGK